MSTVTPPMMYANNGFATRAIHAGSFPDPITGAVVTPISLATTFVQKSPGQHTVNTNTKHTKQSERDFYNSYLNIYRMYQAKST
jgi:cystathionine beta-lyase/cystathionine gamma-synthase